MQHFVDYVSASAPGIQFQAHDARAYFARLGRLLAMDRQQWLGLGLADLASYADPVCVFRVQQGVSRLENLHAEFGLVDENRPPNRTAVCNAAYCVMMCGGSDRDVHLVFDIRPFAP